MRQTLPIILIRILVSLVFITEGVLKFIFPGEFGAGRFAHIGLPFAAILGPLTGIVEICAGAAVLANFYAGDAALILLAVIATAIVSTKLPILLARPLGPFVLPKNIAHYGLLGFLHEARTDLSMLFCLVAILFESGAQLGRKKHWYQR